MKKTPTTNTPIPRNIKPLIPSGYEAPAPAKTTAIRREKVYIDQPAKKGK